MYIHVITGYCHVYSWFVACHSQHRSSNSGPDIGGNSYDQDPAQEVENEMHLSEEQSSNHDGHQEMDDEGPLTSRGDTDIPGSQLESSESAFVRAPSPPQSPENTAME